MEFPTYAEVKTEFEKTHFKLQNPFCYCQLENDNIIIRSKDEMKSLYENKYYTHEETTVDKKGTTLTEKKTKQFVISWMLDVNIKTYKELVFEPCKTVPENVYNIWRGWKASKLPETKLKFEDSVIYQHLKYIFNETFEFQCDRFAYILQTGNKTDTADVLQSVPGVGKDTAYNYLGNNIIGEQYYLNEDFIDMIIGDSFNDIISKKVLVVLNESKKAKTDEIIDALKNAITREKNNIRAKFVKPREETNHINWATLTNNFDSIKIEHGDRRFMASTVSKERKGDTKYFMKLHDEIKSKRYDRACYDFFMKRVIKIKSFQDERPITSYYSDLQERNIPTTAQFLIDIMHNEKNNEYKATATEFYNRFGFFLKENGFDYKINSTKFGLEMKQYPVVKKVDTNKCRFYKINIKELEEYLLKEKLYKPTKESTAECSLFNPEQYIKPDDKAVYIRIEDHTNQLNDAILENDNLKDMVDTLNDVNEDAVSYIKKLEKYIEYLENKKESKPLKNQDDFIQLSDNTFLDTKTNKTYELANDSEIEFDGNLF